jgi:hypothetical protein
MHGTRITAGAPRNLGLTIQLSASSLSNITPVYQRSAVCSVSSHDNERSWVPVWSMKCCGCEVAASSASACLFTAHVNVAVQRRRVQSSACHYHVDSLLLPNYLDFGCHLLVGLSIHTGSPCSTANLVIARKNFVPRQCNAALLLVRNLVTTHVKPHNVC